MLLLNAFTAIATLFALAAFATPAPNVFVPIARALDEAPPSGGTEPAGPLLATRGQLALSPIRIHLASNPWLCLGSSNPHNNGAVNLVPCSDRASLLTAKVQDGHTYFGFGVPPSSPTCLDVREGNTGLPAQTWECVANNPNQQFVWYSSTSKKGMLIGWEGTRTCLTVEHLITVKGGGPKAGEMVGWAPCKEGNALQEWVHGDYTSVFWE